MRNVFNRHGLLAAPSQSCSGFATLGRPVSLPLGKQPHHRSSSDPDLPGSNPGSPDAEVAGLLGMYTLTPPPPPGQQPGLTRHRGRRTPRYVHSHTHVPNHLTRKFRLLHSCTSCAMHSHNNDYKPTLGSSNQNLKFLPYLTV